MLAFTLFCHFHRTQKLMPSASFFFLFSLSFYSRWLAGDLEFSPLQIQVDGVNTRVTFHKCLGTCMFQCSRTCSQRPIPFEHVPKHVQLGRSIIENPNLTPDILRESQAPATVHSQSQTITLVYNFHQLNLL